jgi:hypothetical protein
MDFKSLISKIDSMDDPIQKFQAPEKSEPIRLDEDTEFRVLAGITQLTESVISEKAVSKKQQRFMGMVHAAKKGEKPASPEVAKVAKSMSGKEAEKFASTKHKGLPEKKKKAESVEEASDAKKAAQEKFKAMVAKKKEGKKVDEAAKPDFLDIDKDGNKKEPMKKAAKDKKVKESAKPDFLDMDKDGDKKEPMKKAVADKKKGAVKKESVQSTKKVVAESVEQKLSFKDMMKLVVESGGQQQIDPVDTALFDWATRVAKQKLGEGMKAEVYAGMVYERMGGKFEMYDVLSEEKK